MRNHRVQVEGPVRLVAMQIDRDGSDGDVRQAQGNQGQSPPRQIQQAIEEHFEPLF